MMAYRVVDSRRVTSSAAEVASVLWPLLGSDLTDVDLGQVARSMDRRLCDVTAMVKQLIETGVVAGVLRDGRCRLKRACGTLSVVATLQHVECEMLYLDGVPPVVQAEPTVTQKRRKSGGSPAVLTQEEFSFAAVLWTVGLSTADGMTRKEILRKVADRGYATNRAALLLTALCQYNALTKTGRGAQLTYKFVGVGAKCMNGGSSDFRRYDGSEL